MPTPVLIMIVAWIVVAGWVAMVIGTQRKFHPKALFMLFFAEMWERFSFYGMRALLVLFMTQLLFEYMGDAPAEERAYGIYGAYGALVYGTPVIGGLLADRYLGFRKAIILGGVLMACGHLTLSLGDALYLINFVGLSTSEIFFFYPGLALLILGNGYFKPNISSLLGKLYDRDDPRKDSGFTLFYMGINVGAFLAPLTCGALGELYGWQYGFGLAGIGMIIGLIVFWKGMSSLGNEGLPPNPERLRRNVLPGISRQTIIIAITILSIPFFSFLVNRNELMDYIMLVLGVVVLGYLLYEAIVVQGRVAGQQLGVIIILIFFHMLFWSFFEQAGSSLTLFTEKNVIKSIFGAELETSMFQSVNPGFIILLAPAFSALWVWLGKRKMDPFTPNKFAWGLVQLGLGFLAFVVGGMYFANDQAMVPVIFLFLGYLLHTTGELSLSPVGLSMVTKLAPAKIVGFVMGAWFLSISFAHFIAGGIAKLTAIELGPEGQAAEPGAFAIKSGYINESQVEEYTSEILTNWDSLASYMQVFEPIGYVAIGSGLLLFILAPFIRKWMHGVH